ncbi:hypothetical protein [Nitrosomonas sp. Nm58]|jgi:hypothetical protein|uniref:hypothetical protein n=1 Tax=Nitrosomonas sp. Nm58 TaxID=200126 RepID=UPI00089C158A|nr:hypothetical protein [Nitrosomonas sp. Nm58]SDY12917.1 hypothetical protein SAMN05421754_100237 [Nitrosomonas sp. Nm58]
MKKLIVLGSFIGLLLPFTLHAQSMGVFCWRINPFSDVLCFDIASKGFVFELTGTQKTSAYEVPSHGAANFDRLSNRFHVGFTSHLSGGFLGQFFVSMNTESLNGTWTDITGLSGNFTFLGEGPLNPVISSSQEGNYLSHIVSP